MQLVKTKDTGKVRPPSINSIFSCDESRDLICIFCDNQIDKK